jgi:hypothetical protein
VSEREQDQYGAKYVARHGARRTRTVWNRLEHSGRIWTKSSGIEIREDTCITMAFPMHTRVCPASLLILPILSYNP